MFEILLMPHIILLIITAAITTLIVLLNKVLVNQKVVKEIKTKMAEIRESLTKAQKEGNMEVANNLLSEMLKANSDYMRQNFKVLIVSMLVIVLVMPFMGSYFGGMTVAMPFSLPILGSNLNWAAWYILVSFAMSWVIKKMMEVE